MWEPLHGLLTSETSEDEIKRHVLWIIGTDVQNNPSAQVSVRPPHTVYIIRIYSPSP